MRNRKIATKAGEPSSVGAPPPVGPTGPSKEGSQNSVVIKESFYKTGTIYSLTLNPEDKYQFSGKVDRRHKIKETYRSILDECGADYKLKMEFSEPNGMMKQGYFGPRLHYHGTIQFKNNSCLYEFLNITLRKLLSIGIVDIDVCNDPTIWWDYCTKQKIIKDKLDSIKIQIIDPFKKESSEEDLDPPQ